MTRSPYALPSFTPPDLTRSRITRVPPPRQLGDSELDTGEPWYRTLRRGDTDAAWDLFIDRYRGLIFAVIRRYARESDEVMDVFAAVCEALRHDELARLRRYWDTETHRARFSTWLATVVRNLTIDWLRQRFGRRRLREWSELSPLQQRIAQQIFDEGCSHVEAYEIVRSTVVADLSFGTFVRELAATYKAIEHRFGAGATAELAGGPALVEEEIVLDPAALEDRARHVREMLESLPADERTAIELYVMHGMSAADVARVVRWRSEKTVYNRVYRALARLRTSLEGRGLRREDL